MNDQAESKSAPVAQVPPGCVKTMSDAAVGCLRWREGSDLPREIDVRVLREHPEPGESTVEMTDGVRVERWRGARCAGADKVNMTFSEERLIAMALDELLLKITTGDEDDDEDCEDDDEEPEPVAPWVRDLGPSDFSPEREALRRAWEKRRSHFLTLRRAGRGSTECGVCGAEGDHAVAGWAVRMGDIPGARWGRLTVCPACLRVRVPALWAALMVVTSPADVVETVVRTLSAVDGVPAADAKNVV